MNDEQKFVLKFMVVIIGSFIGSMFIGMLLVAHRDKQVEPKEIPLFSCYKIEGTKCTVSSNKENPCSYTVVVCRTSDKKEIFRSEKVPSLIF